MVEFLNFRNHTCLQSGFEPVVYAAVQFFAGECDTNPTYIVFLFHTYCFHRLTGYTHNLQRSYKALFIEFVYGRCAIRVEVLKLSKKFLGTFLF